jgi:peroxiredoxin
MGKGKRLLLICAVTGFAGLTVWVTWLAKRLDSQQPGGSQSRVAARRQAPDLALRDLNGQFVRLSDFKGQKNVLLSFWASWSKPCRLEMPNLRSLYEQKGKLNLEILAVNLDPDAGAAERFTTEQKLTFPVLLDPSRETAKTFGVQVIPSLFLIDKRGNMLQIGRGLNPGLATSLPMMLEAMDRGASRGMNRPYAPGN